MKHRLPDRPFSLFFSFFLSLCVTVFLVGYWPVRFARDGEWRPHKRLHFPIRAEALSAGPIGRHSVSHHLSRCQIELNVGRKPGGRVASEGQPKIQFV